MKKQNSLGAYILIGIGIYFLLRELQVPIFTNFYSWQTLLIIIGFVILIYSYRAKQYEQILPGTIFFGIGVHLHGLEHYPFWINHWAIYPIIVGIAFLLQYLKTKKNLLTGIILIGLALLFLFSSKFQSYFYWINDLIALAVRFWPVLLIILGILLLRNKK